jgi:acyl-coenzyme A thioesterase PaaI-like protein
MTGTAWEIRNVLAMSEAKTAQASFLDTGVLAVPGPEALRRIPARQSPQPPRFTALDLKVNFLRPVHPHAEELAATGSVTHRGRSLSIGNAVVTYQGRRIAIATGTTALAPPE